MDSPRYILITGGTKGIGKAVADNMAEAGYDLILTFNEDHETALAASLDITSRYSVKVETLSADISKQESIKIVNDYLQKNDLYLEAIVFNAGLTCRDSFENLTFEAWQKVFDANVNFPVFMLQTIIGRIKKGGSVVFTGSLMGIEPHSVSLAYGVSKAAVHALVKNLVKFLAPYEVRVNAVAPGFVDTEWQKTKPQEIRNNIERKVAIGRFCQPEEVAEVYRMLIENKYFNGEIVVVDGGYSFK